ncbi:hypothetical protein NIES267_14140 [Calothrix parasitica NIES-267]|uniref:Uncharacterized protein n=1 Tax=Calothrix parasitica NIES-267 TaxID=1973488 RepID=A0A1Z4LL30_9CYAN|nr:hypothetical protein NIES267_14140 [Calothrix parasitica NIES-267]
MPQNTSCLLALVLAVGSALITIPSHAQTTAETTKNTTASSSQASVNNQNTASKSEAVNKNKATDIAQSEPVSTTANTPRENAVYSRIGWLKQ